MWRNLLIALAVLLALAWLVTRPNTITDEVLPKHDPNVAAGERIFWAGGCASCHAGLVDNRRAGGEDKLLLGGGLELDTPFGLFRVPNISSHQADGIGAWSMVDFVNAMQRGVSPSGKHYYPAFPYTSYARMPVTDVMDLKAYLDTLPPVAGRAPPHELSFPYNIRRGLGLWKRRYLSADPVVPSDDPLAEAGRVLAEGAGHCGECHTGRDPFGGLDLTRWLGGADNPDGPGRIPNITPGRTAFASWTEEDLAYYFESGLTPDYDTVGGSMVAVQENLAALTDSDRRALARYLVNVPAVDVTEAK